MAQVLLVDDEPEFREEAVEILSRDGHAVLQAGDGKEALAIIRSHPVEVIILDILLPEKDGLEVIQQVRHEAAHIRYIPIIAMSGGGSKSKPGLYLTYSKCFGADYVLPKPFSADDIRAAIREVFHR